MHPFLKQVLNIWLFAKASVLIQINKKRALETKDLIPFNDHDPRTSQRSNRPSLLAGTAFQLIFEIMGLYRKIVFRCLGLSCLRVTCALLAPVLIYHLLRLLSAYSHEQLPDIIQLAILFTMVSMLGGVIINQCFYWDFTAFQLYQRLLNTAIYQKILRFSNHVHQQLQVSNLVNLISNDTHYLSNLGYIVNDLFYITSLFISVICLLFFYLGSTAFITILSIVLFNPLAYLIMKGFGKSDVKQATLREERISLLNQIIKGIFTIKLLSLEKKSINEINTIRATELRELKNRAYISAFSFMVFGSVTSFISFCTFSAYLYFGGTLDPATVFTTLSLIVLLEVPLSQLSDVISDASSAYISAKRIVDFLNQSQATGSNLEIEEKSEHLPLGIEIRAVNLDNFLKNISLEIPAGESVAILGPVGSGKSSLLRCLLEKRSGPGGTVSYISSTKEIKPVIGYLSQEPFIIHGTIKENILLGQSVSLTELNQALYSCALDKDILQFSDGLDTKLGENGIHLSGGQKQRLNLCRILVHKPALLLLDDPFSAVDSRTKNLLINRLLFSEWQQTTRIVATSSIEHLERFDQLIYMVEGEIIAKGTLDELLKNPAFAAYYQQQHHQHEQQINPAIDKETTTEPSKISASATSSLHIDERYIDKDLKTKAYQSYVQGMAGKGSRTKSFAMYSALIALVLITTAAPILQNVWLALWTNFHELNGVSAPYLSIFSSIFSNNKLALGIYSGLIVFSALSIFFQRALWFRQAAIASQTLHDRSLKRLMATPMRFFDTTPTGIILSIFSRDLAIIEKDLKWTFENVVRVCCQILATLGFMIICLPFIVFFIGPALFFYYRTQEQFRKISRQVKWMTQVNQAHLNSHLKETVENIMAIQAMREHNYFEKKFFKQQHCFQQAAHTQETVDRWFSTRVPLISGIISLIISLTAVLAVHYNQLSPGIAGLTFTYLIGFWTQLNWSVRAAALVESNMTSVERLNCVAQLPEEQDDHRDTVTDLTQFKGSIEFHNVSVKYAKHLPTILKNISFSLAPGTSIGVVGRTGAGKSTLIQAMLRLCELSAGEIRIDGINIKQMSLAILREIICVIPQTPFIFSASIRENLDPFKQHSDQEIYHALEKTGLSLPIGWLPNGLDTQIHSSGQNISQGQKQLLCIARALLRNPKIIIMDEITANLDKNTDLFIHERLNATWQGITKIIISHRPTAIHFCDQVLHLDNGRGVINNRTAQVM